MGASDTAGGDAGEWDTGAADVVAGAGSASDDGAADVLARGRALGDGSSARACAAAVRVTTQRPRSSARPRSSRELIRTQRATVEASSPARDRIGPASLISECPMVFKAVPRSARRTDFWSVRDRLHDMTERSGSRRPRRPSRGWAPGCFPNRVTPRDLTVCYRISTGTHASGGGWRAKQASIGRTDVR